MTSEAPAQNRPILGIDDRPKSWWESVVYGWQHTLVDISPFILPLAVAAGLGLTSAETARFINFGLVAMGVATLMQTTIGSRLPIIQGPSATLVGTLGPLASQIGAGALWGAVFLGGLIEAALGGLRIVGTLRRLLPSAVSGTVIVAIGLGLGQLAVRLSLGDGSGRNLLYAGLVIGLVVFLQLGLAHVWGGLLSRAAIFLAIWTVGLGVGGALGGVDWSLVAERPWIELPALFPYGGPGFGWTIAVGAFLVVLVGYLGSMVESLGDYAATCEVAGVEYDKSHMNRGIFAEGLGCSIAAVLGGLPCTSYTQNIGIIASTRIASRFVVQVAAGILILYGLCPKFGALLVAMPRAVLGGVFLLICGMITVSGIRLLARVPATQGNAMVIGPTLVLSLALPPFVQGTLGAEWLAARPTALGLMLTNGVVIAVVVGIVSNLIANELLGRGGASEEESPS